MDACEFFYQIVTPNCDDAMRQPFDLRSAWNAILSLNTMPEFLALHRLVYRDNVDRKVLDSEADKIRKEHLPLAKLNNEAIKLKHVRRLSGQKRKEPFSSTPSSTSYLISEPTPADILKLIHDAFETIKAFPEFSPTSRCIQL
jgi:hypothetical protein